MQSKRIVKSSRVGGGSTKVMHTIFVGTNGVIECGHHHTSARSAKRCIANMKRREQVTSNSNWYVRAYLPATDPQVGRREVPQS